MPRKPKPRPDMPDKELFESLFPRPVKDRIRKDVELDTDEEEPENAEDSDR